MDNRLSLRGTVIRLLPVQEGVSKAGKNWRRTTFVIETDAQYPRTVCFQLWNDRIDQYALREGDHVEVFFDIESREFNERFYTDATAYEITRINDAAAAPQAPADPFAGQQPYTPPTAGGYATQAPPAGGNQFGGSFDPNVGGGEGDLPF